MKWKKLQHLFVPENNYGWMVTHAANPFAVNIGDGIFRIYFTCRNQQNQSHIGFVEMDFNNNYKVLQVSPEPVLSPGERGLFDDSGVAMGTIVQVNDKQHLYYLGWNLKVTVPWLNSIGLAVYDPELNKFIKAFKAPVMDRSHEDPFSISYPSILLDNGTYRMWYGSNLSWGKYQNEMQHVIKYAESTDGIHWKRLNIIAVNLMHEGEYALSKPLVIKEINGDYSMWYSYRGNGSIATYRIGYATSNDGLKWIRRDNEVGIEVSEQGWDSEMICYPFIFDYKENRYMIYNGNEYGKTGFGLALLEK